MSGPEEKILFDAILRPYRSLGRGGFVILMSCICGISLAVSVLFYAIGAWPVIGFFGLDVLALYIAFRINYRRARAFESLNLTPSRLRVEKVDIHGHSNRTDLMPYWLRIDLQEPDNRTSRLCLWSHGAMISVGDFLPAAERSRLAQDLEAALYRLRNPIFS